MKTSRTLLLILLISVLVVSLGCPGLAKIKGSASGTVFVNGKPMMGQVQVVDPKSKGSLQTEPVNNAGHFIITNIPPGEWLLAFLGPTSMPLGNYKYIKIQPGRPLTDIQFEVHEEDPLVQQLLDKLAAKETTAE